MRRGECVEIMDDVTRVRCRTARKKPTKSSGGSHASSDTACPLQPHDLILAAVNAMEDASNFPAFTHNGAIARVKGKHTAQLEDTTKDAIVELFKTNMKTHSPPMKKAVELHSRDFEREDLARVCRYGSARFPILAECPRVKAQVCDLSAHAIDILTQNPLYDPTRCRAFVCDIAQEELSSVAPGSIDIVLMVFVLSALPLASFADTLRKVYTTLKPGGLVCFRDYGLYDLAMMRNAKLLSLSLYYRSDCTLTYFFSKENVVEYFEQQSGFLAIKSDYCTVRLHNRKKNVVMDRVWLHAKLQKSFL